MGKQTAMHRPERIVEKLREAQALLAAEKSLDEVCRQLGISKRTYYLWRQRYGGMQVRGAKRLRELEKENERLKRLLAEAQLDKAILQETLRGNW